MIMFLIRGQKVFFKLASYLKLFKLLLLECDYVFMIKSYEAG